MRWACCVLVFVGLCLVIEAVGVEKARANAHTHQQLRSHGALPSSAPATRIHSLMKRMDAKLDEHLRFQSQLANFQSLNKRLETLHHSLLQQSSTTSKITKQTENEAGGDDGDDNDDDNTDSNSRFAEQDPTATAASTGVASSASTGVGTAVPAATTATTSSGVANTAAASSSTAPAVILPPLDDGPFAEFNLPPIPSDRTVIAHYLGLTNEAIQHSESLFNTYRAELVSLSSRVDSQKEALLKWIESQRENHVHQVEDEQRDLDAVQKQLNQLETMYNEVSRRDEQYSHKLAQLAIVHAQAVTQAQRQSQQDAYLTLSNYVEQLQRTKSTLIQQVASKRQVHSALKLWVEHATSLLRDWIATQQRNIDTGVQQARETATHWREVLASLKEVHDSAQRQVKLYESALQRITMEGELRSMRVQWRAAYIVPNKAERDKLTAPIEAKLKTMITQWNTLASTPESQQPPPASWQTALSVDPYPAFNSPLNIPLNSILFFPAPPSTTSIPIALPQTTISLEPLPSLAETTSHSTFLSTPPPLYLSKVYSPDPYNGYISPFLSAGASFPFSSSSSSFPPTCADCLSKSYALSGSELPAATPPAPPPPLLPPVPTIKFGVY